MDKNEFVEKVASLPGVSKKIAEKLYDAGYTDLAKLKNVSVADLQKVEGVGKKTAEAVLAGLKDLEKPSGKSEIQVVEDKKSKASAKTEIVEPEAVHKPRLKPTLDAETRRLLSVRADKKRREPEFRKYHWWRDVSVPQTWRFPRGELNKQRRGFQYRGPRVRVGYGKPAAVRGLHASGFVEIPVYNVQDLEKITDPKTQAARIGGTVGAKKRKEIVEAAATKSIRVLNPRKVAK